MPTLKDVAKAAGVAVATVSRVLNNRGYISEETRQKVYKAMEELNYRPNEIARSLHRRKSHLIGLIIPTVSHPFFAELAGFIEYYAYLSGYKVLICNSLLDRQKEKEYISMLKSNQVDGIIMGSHTVGVEEYMNLPYPIVTFDRYIGEKVPYVSSDNYYGGKLATRLLIEKGCKKIAHISGNLQLNLLANRRFQAFAELTKERGIEAVVIETEMNVFDHFQYENIIEQLFRNHPDIDGIFASSDVIAAHVVRVCRARNKRIPDDIKIVGYDDIRLASLFVPSLTTVRQPIEDMAKRAVELIIRQVNEESVQFENVFPVKLIERETT